MVTAITEGRLDVVERIEPVLREHAASVDVDRTLPKAAMEAMVEGGIFRTWLPLQ
jgi:hypothetical protein